MEANVANTETDRLQLVEIVPVRGLLGIFGRTISVADGFSIEIFRGEQHLGSIFSKDIALASDVKKSIEKLGVRPDDTLYRVNLGAKLLTLSGTFGTTDGFEPGYKVVLEIGVVNPKQFAMRYRQQDDPVRISQVALEGELRRYATLRTHDRLKRDELSFRVGHTLNVGNNKAIGIDVIRVHDIDIYMDSHQQKLRDVARTGEIDQLETREKLKSQFSRDERGREARQQEEQLRLESLSQVANMYTQAQITRLREELEAGRSPQNILADHPELRRIFAVSPPPNLGEIVAENPELQSVFKATKYSVNELAEPEQTKEDQTETSPSTDEQESLEQEINQEELIQRRQERDKDQYLFELEKESVEEAHRLRKALSQWAYSQWVERVGEALQANVPVQNIVEEMSTLSRALQSGLPQISEPPAKRQVDKLAMSGQTKEDQTEISASTDEQESLEQTQRAAMGKYNIQITENVQGSAIGDHAQVTMHFGEPPDHHGKQKNVDEGRQPQLRYLHARLPERAKAADKIPLQARVALSPASNRSTPLRAFSIPPQGADLKLVLDCPGFLLHSASIATVHVAPTADSDWVLFELEALHDGVYTLEISAFNEGAFLGTLSLQLTIDSLAVRGHSVDHLTLLTLRSPQEGEETLVIRYDPLSAVYRYQFRGTTFGETDELHSGPLQRKQEDAVADLVTLLNGQARDLTGYSTEETRRWLQGKGIELWKELIPKELENLFWQQRENIKWMTILSDGDPMPWELMYPTNDTGDDAGFLAEQFPIVRWIFGPAPTTQLQCSRPCFVVPDDAPLAAEDELTALRRIMGDGQNINDLTPLLKLLDNAEFDALHFACHNIFRADSPTSSSIQLGSKHFVPTFLNKYNRHFHSPLVFMNACRSDGMAANYTWLAGWAKSFLAAGAGAFIGSLWEVRDSSASHFAETFYQALHSGIPLGDAMKQARIAIQNEPGDPTWLAYTLYGNPAAILLKEIPKLG
jgi:CHAT domain-containing protein